jgi:hypothetical protein
MKLTLYLILMLASTTAIAAGEDYSHSYDTFEIGFSTPPLTTANVQWDTEKPGMKILVDLGTGKNVYAFRHILSTWDSRESTKANLEKLWGSYATGNGHTTPVISELANGDFLVAGRMMVMNSKITRTMRTFDFNGDGRLDYIIFWNGNGNFNYDLLNYLASTTKINLIQTKVSPTTGHSLREDGRVREEGPAPRHVIRRTLPASHRVRPNALS